MIITCVYIGVSAHHMVGVVSFQQIVNKLTSILWSCLVHLKETVNMDLSMIIHHATLTTHQS